MRIETIEKETNKKEKIEQYVAMDGEVFSTEEDCINYEIALKKVLEKKLKKYIIGETNEYDLIKAIGCDDHGVDIYKIENAEVARDLNTYLALIAGYNSDEPDLFNEYIGKEICLAWNYDRDYCWWYEIDELIKNIKSTYEKAKGE